MSIAKQFVKPKAARSAAKPRNIDISMIRVDGGTQSRAGIDGTVVQSYAEDISDGIVFPPVVVFHDGETYWLADGFHRHRAHLQAGKKKIAVEVRQGTRREAMLHSVGANSDHGLRRTNEDKRRAVITLLNDAEWSQWSVNRISQLCHVSRDLVLAVQNELTCRTASEATPPTPPEVPEDVAARAEEIRAAGGEPRFYRNRYGNVSVMNTGAIGSPTADAGATEEQPAGEVEDSGADPAPAAAEDDENEAFRAAAAEKLPQAIKDREAFKEKAKADRKAGRPEPEYNGLTAEQRIAELEEANRVLEREVEELRAENKLYREMKAEFESGGFAAVIAGRDKVIESQKIRIESESQEKVRNLRSADRWRKIAIDLGYTSREVIEIDG